jgi:hypothetical protein
MSSSSASEEKGRKVVSLLLELIHTSHGQARDDRAPPRRPNLCSFLPTGELETTEGDDLPASSDIAGRINPGVHESVES